MRPPLPAIARLVDTGESIPLFLGCVSAGPPQPVEADLHVVVDLAEVLGIAGTSYVVRAEGDSMTGDGIQAGDALVVNVDAEAVEGDVVVAVVDGEMTVKRLRRRAGRPVLVPGNAAFDEIPVTDETRVWGVVATVVRDLRRRS